MLGSGTHRRSIKYITAKKNTILFIAPIELICLPGCFRFSNNSTDSSPDYVATIIPASASETDVQDAIEQAEDEYRVQLPEDEAITYNESQPAGGTGNHRATRQLEYYNNTHISNVESDVRLAQIRGGTCIAFGNTYTGDGMQSTCHMREEDGPDRFGWLDNYPGYDPHRVWMWNNTVNGEEVEHGYTCESDATFVIQGRNLFYEKPTEYTALQYPHPWR